MLIYFNKFSIRRCFFSVFVIHVFFLTSINLNAQYRFIPAHSEMEDRLIGSALSKFESFRQNRQSPEFLEALSLAEGLDTGFNARHFSFFTWSNPEYTGYRKTRFMKTLGMKRLLGDCGLTHPNRFYTWKNEKHGDYFVINPLIDGAFGPQKLGLKGVMLNGRGAEVMAQMGNDVAIYSRVLDYQTVLPADAELYRNNRGQIPGVGFHTSNFLGYTDYFFATGYMDVKVLERRDSLKKLRYNIRATMGYDQQHIGVGYRSLILSNTAPPSLFFQVLYKLGPFRYQNLFKELMRDGSVDASLAYNKKYLAMHRGILVFEKLRLELGFSESIIQTRPYNRLDWSYVNPIIFYRAVERDLGSPDNALIAFDCKWQHGRWMTYGQLVLDEFHVSKAFTEPQSTANKFGQQMGLYYSFGTKKWNSAYLNLEYNRVRPHTYSHYTSNHYTHWRQSLAHPLESNFRELSLRGFMVPRVWPRWSFRFLVLLAWKGYNSRYENFGGDILENYQTATGNGSSLMLAGLFQRRFLGELDFGYVLQPGMSLRLRLYRFGSDGYQAVGSSSVSLGLRWNFQ
jgi:hypothetical protein